MIEFWFIVSTMCFTHVYEVVYSSNTRNVFNYPRRECIQQVEISTFPVTAKAGETVYHIPKKKTVCQQYGHYWSEEKNWSKNYINTHDGFVLYGQDIFYGKYCRHCKTIRKKTETWVEE